MFGSLVMIVGNQVQTVREAVVPVDVGEVQDQACTTESTVEPTGEWKVVENRKKNSRRLPVTEVTKTRPSSIGRERIISNSKVSHRNVN